MGLQCTSNCRKSLRDFLGVSLLVHLGVYGLLIMRGGFEFSRPLSSDAQVAVQILSVPIESPALDAIDQEAPRHPTAESAGSGSEPQLPSANSHGGEESGGAQVEADGQGTLASGAQNSLELPGADAQPSAIREGSAGAEVAAEYDTVAPPKMRALPVLPPPLRTAAEFLRVSRECLTYRLSMVGIPVGSAELEARNEKGELRLSLRVTTNAAMSAVFQVDDLIETRHVAGNFIISKIRQREGSYQSRRGFTISLRNRDVFWIDLATNRSTRESLPSAEVTDILSGIYYLRNQALSLGDTKTVQVYDSDAYALVPATVVRREKLSSPVGDITDALVVEIRQPSTGMLRNLKEMQVWLSDDEMHVPLRVETVTRFGKLSAELVSSEVELPPTSPHTASVNRGMGWGIP